MTDSLGLAIPGRDSALLELLRRGVNPALRLRLSFLLRRDAALEVALSVARPFTRISGGVAASNALSKHSMEILSRVALPGFAPVAPTRDLMDGMVVPVLPPCIDVLSGLTATAPITGPRKVSVDRTSGLLLPPTDAPMLTLDRALIGLAEAGCDVDLVLEVTADTWSAQGFGVLSDAQRRLVAATHAPSAVLAGRASAALARVERWLRAEGDVLKIEAALRFPARAESGLVGVAEALLFGSDGSRPRTISPKFDLSAHLLPGQPAPTIVPHPLTVEAIAAIVRRRRPRPPKGAVLRLGVDEVGREVAIKADDLRQHAYLVGQTGVGKSTFLKNLALGDAKAGVPLFVIDPHGDLHAELVEELPKSTMDNAIIADVGDFDAPFTLNILDVQGPHAAIQRNFIANQMITLFKIIYDGNKDAFGPVFEQFFRSALFLLMDAGGQDTSLLDLEKVFGDSAFRRSLLEKCSDPQVVSFWKNIALKAGGDLSLENVAPYITSKLAQIAGNPLVRPIVCGSRTTLDLQAALAEGRTVLVNLAKGLVGGPDAAIIGGIITIRLVAAAMARARLPSNERRLTRVILDEFQTYGAHGILSEAMAEVRKYGLSVILANQSVAQIDGRGTDVAHAILGNAGNLVAFRVGPKDAAMIAEWLGPEVSPQALMRLPNHTCMARLLRNGVPLPPTLIRPECRW